MKKLLLLSICLFFLSCSSDDNNIEKEPALENTQWEKVENSGLKSTFIFNQSDCHFIIFSDVLGISTSIYYEYYYNHPEVTLIPKESGKAKLEGIVNNNKMRITNTSTNEEIGVFTKK